jgi:hypothetical protein
MFKTTGIVITSAMTLLLASSAPAPVSAQSQADVLGSLGSNEGIFVDAKSFQIAKGKAKGDPSANITKLGAKEVGPGAIIFRHGDRLYLVEGAPKLAPQAMKDFQNDWRVSYVKAIKEFQDNYTVSYMREIPGDVRENYLTAVKDFQENWNASYMNALKEFQDNWSVSYMKSFQDDWNVSYVKALKEFQDNWATSYLK